MTSKQRLELLKELGFDTENFLSLTPDEKIEVNLNEDIIAQGYIKSTKLYRRFIMAQMFKMINQGYNECLQKHYSFKYQFDMLKQELKVLSVLEQKDKTSFVERSHFFNKEVVVQIFQDYENAVKEYIDKLPMEYYKNEPGKKINGINIREEDLNEIVFYPLVQQIKKIISSNNYAELYTNASYIIKHMIKLPSTTNKSTAWIDAYKGEGAFYTLKNLIMYHDCKITTKGKTLDTRESMMFINEALDLYKGAGWRMFTLLKKVISDNHFDFYRTMREIYK